MIITQIFSGKTSKEKESIQDCQDAFQIEKKCFAIADGASQSLNPSIWADMLVKQFCENPNITNENWQNWLKPIQDKWLIDVQDKIRIAKEQSNSSWFYNNKKLTEQKQPAAATFVGVELKRNILDVTIIGDSCMFIWQDNKFTKSMPYNKSTDFDNFPQYLASFEKDNKFQPQFIQYPIKNGEETYCILATDAFAKWIFANLEAKENVFETLIHTSSQSQFEEIVANARNSKTIKLDNDDVALLVVKISEENLTVEGGTNEIEKITTENKSLRQKNKLLKLCILCVFFVLAAVFFCNITRPKKNTQSISQLQQLPKGTVIYNENDIIVCRTDTTFQVKILEETDSLVKFEFVGYFNKKEQ
jgi:serine/threonine protein phosphatase PrpC